MSSTPKSSKSSGGAASPARHPFDPIVDEHSKILILGSFPSLKSFENHFYYAHPRNLFWPILGEIFQKPVTTKEERIALLKSVGIALWDVVEACERTNSADSNLKSCEPNDIPALLEKYPNIRAILFTGKKAQSLFERYFPQIDLPRYLLPSPSPAYAAMPYEEKVVKWREIFKRLELID
ncbi:DNA-deoxyinosine glycosylase [Hydrogenimonas sp.]|uniref:DNA-deoxyinosine glycosylase n=1 Tax=Hydrogenimonas sp. TaxID=2231112 RepID=UPI00262D5000|nr:DNA-deoxyinosine glycosylase [Hydrogenimonas sp.]